MGTKEMRAVYCETLIDLAKGDERILVVEADLMRASGTMSFQKDFPERANDVGVAEAIWWSKFRSQCSRRFLCRTFGCLLRAESMTVFHIRNYAI